jgi:hypothetical protein
VIGRNRFSMGGRADRDHRVQQRIELPDAPQIEIRQLHGIDPVRVHQRLELRNRRLVDVDSGDLRVGRICCETCRRNRTGRPEREDEYRREDEQTPKSAAHWVTSPLSNAVTAGIGGPGPGDPGADSITASAAKAAAGRFIPLSRRGSEFWTIGWGRGSESS